MAQFAIDEILTTGIAISGFVFDVSNNIGTNGYVLTSTSSGVMWQQDSSNADLASLSGQIAATGSLLNNRINSLSGYAGSTFLSGQGTANWVSRWNGTKELITGSIYDLGTGVGIGTTRPVSLLTVGAAGSTSAANGISFGGDVSSNIYRDSNASIRTDGAFLAASRIRTLDYIQFNTNLYPNAFTNYIDINIGNLAANNWQSAIRINPGGYVGVGTTQPSGKLHVVSTIAGETVLRADGTNGTLFSVTDDLSDSLMSVNNSAGLPVFEVFADDRIVGGQYGSGDFVLKNNKIGIGVLNPGEKLDVNGNVRIGLTTTNVIGTSNTFSLQTRAINIQPNSSTDTLYIRYLSDGNYQLQTATAGANGGNLHLQPYGGNVGIGITNPNTKLKISGSFSQRASGTTAVQEYKNITTFNYDGYASGGYVVKTPFRIGSTYEMSIVHVKGYGYGGSSLYDFKVVFYDFAPSHAPINYSLVDLGNDGSPKYLAKDSNNYINVCFGQTGDVNYYYRFTVDCITTRHDSDFSQGWGMYQTTGANFGFASTGVYALNSPLNFRTNLGVGLGTTNPQNKLSVIGSVNIGSNNFNTAAPTNGLIIEGNAGIGLTNPVTYINGDPTSFRPNPAGKFLDIYSSTNEASINLITNNSGDGSGIGGLYFTRARGQSDNHYQIAAIKGLQDGSNGLIAGGKLYFYTKQNGSNTLLTSPAMVINSNADVGIGITQPGGKLHVSGSNGHVLYLNQGVTGAQGGLYLQNVDQFALSSARLYFISGDSILFTRGPSNLAWAVSQNANVGIGVTNPSEKLTITGAVKILTRDGANFKVGDGSNNPTFLEFDYPDISTSNAYFRIFRNTNTVGGKYFQIFKGDGTATSQTLLNANGDSHINAIAGNLGIGTDSPNHLLNLSTVTSDTSIGLYTTTPNANARNWLISANDLAYGDFSLRQSLAISGNPRTSGVSRFYITNNGNVGIGTDNPSNYKLDVIGTVRASGELISEGNNARISLFRLGGINYFDWASGQSLYFSTESSAGGAGRNTVMSITSGGNVGVGTVNALAPIHIGGNASNNDPWMLLDINDTYFKRIIFSEERLAYGATGYGGYIGYDANNNMVSLGTYHNTGEFRSINIKRENGNVGIGTTATHLKLNVSGSIYMAAGSGSAISWATDISSQFLKYDSVTDGMVLSSWAHTTFLTQQIERVRIVSNGNVGIGTATPSSLLSVGGAGSTSASSGITFGGDSTANLYRSSAGALKTDASLGIGINPVQKLQVEGVVGNPASVGTTQSGIFRISNTTDNAVLDLGIRGGGLGAWIQSTDETSLSATYPLLLNPNGGSVGIGITNPSGQLHLRNMGFSNQAAIPDSNTFPNATGVFGLVMDGDVYTNGQYRHRFVKVDRSANLPLYLQQAGGVANQYINLVRFGTHSQSTNTFEVFGDSKINGTADITSNLLTSGNVGIGINNPSVKLAVNGEASFGDGSKLTLIGLDINSGATPSFIKIRTKIPFASLAADFTINIKGFRYNGAEIANLSICWHYYLSTFYNASISSAGSFAPTVKLSAEDWDSSGTPKVCIVLVGPGYWPKLYVESMYSSAYNDEYADGWDWVDADATGTGNNLAILSYKSNFGNNFLMLNNGYVGIGSANPTQRLDVGGYVMAGEGVYRTSIYGTNGGAWIGFGDTGSLNSLGRIGAYSALFNINSLNGDTSFQYNGSEKMRITTAGTVGIGTTNPTQKLEVSGTVKIQSLGAYSDPTDNAGFLNYDTNGGIFTLSARSNAGNTYMAFRTSNGGTGSEKVRITNNGFVGISSNAPIDYLDFGGAGKNIVFGYAAYGEVLNSAASIIGNNVKASPTANSQVRRFANANDQGNFIKLIYNKGVTFHTNITSALNTDISEDTNERMRINLSGDVGIGTISPVSKLDVNGGISLSGYLFADRFSFYHRVWEPGGNPAFYLGDISDPTNYYDNNTHIFRTRGGGAERMRISSAGNVGIGTFSPSVRLHIENSGTVSSIATVRLVGSTGNNAGSQIEFYKAQNPKASIGLASAVTGGFSDDLLLLSSNPNSIILAAGSSGLAVFKPDGKVGIGVVNPISLLSVGGSNSTVAGSGISFGQDAQANLYRSAEDTIKTDGSLTVAGLVYNNNSAYYASVSEATTSNWGQYTIILGNSNYSNQLIQVTVDGGNVSWNGIFVANASNSYRPTELWGNVKLLEYSTYNCNVDDVVLNVMSNTAPNLYGGTSLVLKTNSLVDGGSGTGQANVITVTLTGPAAGSFGSFSNSWTSPYTYITSTSANTKQIYSNEAGRVGVGTTSPVQKFQIDGTVGNPASVGTTQSGIFRISNATDNATLDFGLRPGGGGAWIQSTDKTSLASNYNLLLNPNGGNVGIGTLSPSGRLSVDFAGISAFNVCDSFSSNVRVTIGTINTAGYTYGLLQSYQHNTNAAGGPFILQPLGGNIGIGTTVPTGLLNVARNSNTAQPIAFFREIYGSPAATNVLLLERGNNLSSVNQTSSNAGLRIRDHSINYSLSVEDHNSNVNFAISGAKVMLGSRGTSSLLNIGGAGSTAATSGITFGEDSVVNLYRLSASVLKTDAAFTAASLSSSSYVYAATYLQTAAGQLYAGAPYGTLTVYVGNIAQNAWESALYIGRGSYVGIGTVQPSGKLHVVSTVAGETVLRADGTNGTLFSVTDDLSDSLMSVNNSAGLPIFEVFADDRIVAGQYASGDFVLRNNKVGIGTTNPNNKLSVIGAASIGGTGYNIIAPNNGLIVEGNVGIGTTNPTTKLSVIGEIYASSRVISDRYASVVNGNNNSILFSSNTTSFVNNGSTAVYIQSDGKVGIGTTVPTGSLNIVGANTAGLLNLYATSFPGNVLRLNSNFAGGNYVDLNPFISSVSNGGFEINLNGTRRLVIEQNGSVGIGTTNPSIYNASIIAATGNSWFQSGLGVFACVGIGEDFPNITATSLMLGPSNTRTSQIGKYAAGIGFNNLLNYSTPGNMTYAQSPHAWIGLRTDTFPGHETCALAFATRLATDGSANSTVERMCLTPSGNVGIGIKNPTTLLSIGGVGATSAASGLTFGSDSSANLYRITTSTIKTDGSLIVNGNLTTNLTTVTSLNINAGTLNGIPAGSTITGFTYAVNNGNVSQLNLVETRFATGSDWTTASTKIQKRVDVTNQAYIEFNPSGSAYGMAFGVGVFGATEAMRIASNGTIGIGITSTSYKLQVLGSFAATTKSFDITHPTISGKRLTYASLEGPENGVYFRGKNNNNEIDLPHYWSGLVHDDSITVNLTSIGKRKDGRIRNYSVDQIGHNKVYIYTDSDDNIYNYYYTIFAERKDVSKLVIERDME